MVHFPKKPQGSVDLPFFRVQIGRSSHAESDFEAALLQNFEDEGLSMKAGGKMLNRPKHEVHFGNREKAIHHFIHSTARSHSGSGNRSWAAMAAYD